MLAAVKQWYNDHKMKHHLLEFLDEMEKNLETFYVMDQRQFITAGFKRSAYESVQGFDFINKSDAIKKYITTIDDFNKSFDAYKEFEQWYTSNTDHKTPDNAKKLHALKNSVDEKLKGMDAVIIPAGQDLEREMLKLRIIRA